MSELRTLYSIATPTIFRMRVRVRIEEWKEWLVDDFSWDGGGNPFPTEIDLWNPNGILWNTNKIEFGLGGLA